MDGETLPEAIVTKVGNLIRDSRLAVAVGLIPILGLIYILRLVQWYLLKSKYPVLNSDEMDDAELTKGFRTALPRLWFAVLFWPVAILLLVIYISLT